MDEGYSSYLRERHEFGAWAEPAEAETGAPITGFVLDGTSLPNWEAVGVDHVAVEGARSAVQSIWRSPQYEETLLRVDVIEMPSAGGAREMVLRLLGEFQSPEIRRRTEGGIGDVAFEMPGSTSILFARRSVVVMVRNAGPRTIGVGDVARELDEMLRR